MKIIETIRKREHAIQNPPVLANLNMFILELLVS